MNNQNPIAPLILRWLEFILFVVAFALIVPPAPSMDGQKYPLWPTLIIGGALFSTSLGLTLYRKADTLLIAALKLAFYLVLAWIIHIRVWDL